MENRTPSNNLPTPARDWALQTFSVSLSGAIFGLTKSLLSSSPLRATLIVSAAYGANCSLVFGTLFGIRSIALYSLPSDVANSTSISAMAGAVTGGAFTSVVSGLRRAPQGALLWGTGCFMLQYMIDQGLEWRNARADEIWIKRGGRPTDNTRKSVLEKLNNDTNNSQSFMLDDSVDNNKDAVNKVNGTSIQQDKTSNMKLVSNLFVWFPFYRTTLETDRQLLERLRLREMDLERELGFREAPAPDERVKLLSKTS